MKEIRSKPKNRPQIPLDIRIPIGSLIRSTGPLVGVPDNTFFVIVGYGYPKQLSLYEKHLAYRQDTGTFDYHDFQENYEIIK